MTRKSEVAEWAPQARCPHTGCLGSSRTPGPVRVSITLRLLIFSEPVSLLCSPGSVETPAETGLQLITPEHAAPSPVPGTLLLLEKSVELNLLKRC